MSMESYFLKILGKNKMLNTGLGGQLRLAHNHQTLNGVLQFRTLTDRKHAVDVKT